MLVRFSNVDGCANCTQTIDFSKLRAIGMLKNANDTYYVRLSFENGDTFLAKDGMSLADAISYRNTLEGYWLSSATRSAASTEVVSV
jgi:hypothetical protein